MPARFGTLLADDRAVEGFLADAGDVLALQLDRVAGAREWVVSVAVADAGPVEDATDDLSPGHAFFARRRAVADGRIRARDAAITVADALDAQLRSLARGFAPLDLQDATQVARGAYLVPDDAVPQLQVAVAACGTDAVVGVQGPLPAYRFADSTP